jgi:hypothetical protein
MSDMSSTMDMSDRGGLSISKPCFKPRWIHLLILEFDANVRLTHDDNACTNTAICIFTGRLHDLE